MLTRADLRPYQERAARHIVDNDGSIMAIDMGLGKTVIGLTAYHDLRQRFDIRRALVIGPLRVARKVWSDEVAAWEHTAGYSVATITGTVAERTKALRTPADIHTINREQIPWLEAQFIENRKQIRRWPWDLVIVDESQSFKTGGAQRTKSLRKLRRLAPRISLLSGTLAPNGLYDLWSQVYLVDGGQRLGTTQDAFQKRWFDCGMEEGYTKWYPRDHAMTEIHALIADITISLREQDYLDLPPVQHNYVKVDLGPRALAAYRKMEKALLVELYNGKTITAVNAGVCAGKLLQMANGAVYDEVRAVHGVHDAKIDAMLDLLESVPKPALVGHNFIHDRDRILRALSKTTHRVTTLKTDREFSAWARGEFDVGVLHPASAGHGLNDVYKSGAADMIWFGLTNNLEFYQQLNARLTGGHRRAGRNVVIHHIVADETIDLDMVALLARKDATQEMLKGLLAERRRAI